ncbi:TPA: FhaB [Salmonella enterica]|nr:FhaB [Salmonella enterica]
MVENNALSKDKPGIFDINPMLKMGVVDENGDLLKGGGGIAKGGKPGTGTSVKNIVVVDSGKKGAWNKAMNKPEPNTVYKVDGDKTYHTDSLARPTQVEATLSPNVKDRNGYQQCKAGKCGNLGDEGGHLIASVFNGPGEKLNLLPMDGNLNKGVWKRMENAWSKALSEGNEPPR